MIDVIDRVPGLGQHAAALRQRMMVDRRRLARAYAYEHGEDPAEIRDWTLAGLSGTRPMRILVLNAGSATLKASLVERRPDPRGARRRRGATTTPTGVGSWRLGGRVGRGGAIDAVAHRFVHGGDRFTRRSSWTTTWSQATRRTSSRSRRSTCHRRWRRSGGTDPVPDVPHVACFDTAFHATLPEAEWRYPVPERWYGDGGVRRFGFHGLSVDVGRRGAPRSCWTPGRRRCGWSSPTSAAAAR